MNLTEQWNSVRSREDLIEFVAALIKDFADNQDSWENTRLDRFPEALAA
jgi:hypothetical protein